MSWCQYTKYWDLTLIWYIFKNETLVFQFSAPLCKMCFNAPTCFYYLLTRITSIGLQWRVCRSILITFLPLCSFRGQLLLKTLHFKRPFAWVVFKNKLSSSFLKIARLIGKIFMNRNLCKKGGRIIFNHAWPKHLKLFWYTWLVCTNTSLR